MNKLIFATIALGAVALASCSNEEFDVKPAGGEGNVTFTASLPASVASRDYSDGSTAKKLTYAIYEAGKEDAEQTPLITGTAEFNNLKATVNTTLATGKTYDILFWAQAADAPYAFDTEKKTVTVDYDGITANNEKLDAFFWAEKDLTVNGPVSKTVKLTRPFAQVNVGTNDFDLAKKAGVDVKQSSLAFSAYVGNALNLYSGNISGEAAVTYGLANIPTDDDGAFPVDDYKYLAMAYVLVGADKQTLDVTLAMDATPNAPVFATVPVQRNYRTNIYGALLTNPAVFNVEINPDFDGDDYDFGAIVAPGVNLNEATKTYSITSPQGLQWLSSQSAGKGNAFSGYTVKLANDIDMAGQEFTPIAKKGSFSGTFDGDGHTIANLTVSDTDCAGLVWSNMGMIKNLTMTNVNVSGNYKVGAIAGDGLCGKFENCTVDGGTITSTPRIVNGKYDDGNNAGGITGYLSAEPNASITGCTVKNVTVEAFRTLGGIAGCIGGTNCVFTDNKVENSVIVANQLSPYGTPLYITYMGEIVGRKVNGATADSSNSATGVTTKTLKATSTGFEVSDAETLAKVADAVTMGNDFKGKTIKLTADLDLAGTEMAPLGSFINTGGASEALNAPFKGTFDGQGHTIANFTTTVTDYKSAAGFFGYVADGAVIKDLTLKNPTVTGTAYTGALVGKADKGGSFVTIANVTVDGATILSVPAKGADGEFDGGNNVGGLVGVTQYGMDVTGCTVKNSTITGYAKVGGMFGLCCNQNQSGDTNHTVYENNKVENCQVIQSLTNAYESSIPTTIGEICGLLSGLALPASNTTSEVTVTPAQ